MTTSAPEHLDQVRKRVVNVLGHELRTPLTTIRGLADLLSDADEVELRTVLIPALVRNARRAERLLDDLLIAGGIETAEPTVAATMVDLDHIVREVVAQLQTDDSHRVDVDSLGHDVTVRAHDDTARRACLRVFENAFTYGSDAPRVHFEVDDDSASVVVHTPVAKEIRDLDLAFELFYRGEAAVTTAAGLGVGLPLARALARMDGGDVQIRQEPGAVITRLYFPRWTS